MSKAQREADERARAAAKIFGYNPDQPRAPAGSADGGQWTSGGGGGSSSGDSEGDELREGSDKLSDLPDGFILNVGRHILRKQSGTTGLWLDMGSNMYISGAHLTKAVGIQAIRDLPKDGKTASIPFKGRINIKKINDRTKRQSGWID